MQKSGSAFFGSIIDNQSRHRRKISKEDLPEDVEVESEQKNEMEFSSSSSDVREFKARSDNEEEEGEDLFAAKSNKEREASTVEFATGAAPAAGKKDEDMME